MSLKTHVVEYSFTCDNCSRDIKAKSHDPGDMPEGYHLHVRRVTAHHNHYVSGPLFFCTKDCLLNAMSYGISSLIYPVEEV